MIRKKLLKYAISPVYKRIRRTEWNSEQKTVQLLKMYEKNQWLPYKRIIEKQQKKLKAMIKHIYENVEFYHYQFKRHNVRPEDIKTPNDLRRLPITTKTDLRKEFPYRVTAKNIPEAQWIFDSTTGTSGTPFQFIQGLNSENIKEALRRRTNHWIGLDENERSAFLWTPYWSKKEKGRLQNLLSKFLNKPIYLSTYDLDESNMINYYNTLNANKPKSIHGYSSALLALARTLAKYNLKLKIDLTITSADKLIDKELMETTFQTTVFDKYGSREFSNIASECIERTGLHINTEHIFVEFLKEGEPVSEGELGEIIVTDLDNTVMPFFRYKIGDVGRPSDDLCPCGMGLPLMQSFEGRITDLIITPKGKYLDVGFFNHLFFDKPEIVQFQIIQKKKNQLLIYLVKDPRLKKREFNSEELIKKIHNNANEHLEVFVEFVDSIPREKGSKFRCIKSEVSVFN